MAKYREGIVLHTMASSCFSVGRLCGRVQGRDCPSHNGIFLFQCRKTLWPSTGKGLSFTEGCFPVVGRLCGKVQGSDCPSDNSVCLFQSTAGRASDVPGKRGLGVVSGQVQLQHSTADGATPPTLLPLALTLI